MIDPTILTSGGNLENSTLDVLSNDACKFVMNQLPISWESFENVNLLYFLL